MRNARRPKRATSDLYRGHRCGLIQINILSRLLPHRHLRHFGSLAVAKRNILGTAIFDGEAAQKGYALNKMCFSFNSAENRAAFLKDEDGYCRRFGLDDAQMAAVRRRNVLDLIAAGGNIYYLAKLAGILGLSVQDIGAQQTGMSVEAFKAKLLAEGA